MKNKFILFLVVLSIGACSTSETNEVKENIFEAKGKETDLRSKYKIEKAEKGVTIVNVNGWTTDQMTFQLSYCEGMFKNITEYNSGEFCACFLNKVQYYYEPIYIKEAYQDQKKWNSICLEQAQN